jgi:Type III restriction enzyme, res subunit/Helicase conserved C-terminal domain
MAGISVDQARKQFLELWPEVSTGLFVGETREIDRHNVVGTVQSLARNLDCFDPDEFTYLLIDEAHHATAESYQKLLRYFRPRFTLGLTATPDRADGLSALEAFRNAAHRLSLREAVELGKLVPIRCVRIRTNIDLSRVRFNQIQYNRRDIEETVLVPSRDQLIVQPYRDHVPGRKAVEFCVNVRHAENLAERLRAEGIAAHSVSGSMRTADCEACLREFARGERALCACDLLNEGWDCPDVEVLLMARLTLSKVIYLQRLGRGTRKALGKECLVVFDFVDNASRYNASLSLHWPLGVAKYRPGALLLAPHELASRDQELQSAGGIPSQVLPVELWARDFEEIDVFNWQEAIEAMLSASDLEVELAAAEGRVHSAVERGQIVADHTLPLSERLYYCFDLKRTEEIRQTLGLPRVDGASIRELFLEFVKRMDKSSSYKPVLLLAMLGAVDERGRGRVDEIARRFHKSYLTRAQRGLVVERKTMRMEQATKLSLHDVRSVMLGMPFRKFEQRKYVSYDREDLAFVRFQSALWRQLKAEDLRTIREQCEQSIADYHERVQS